MVVLKVLNDPAKGPEILGEVEFQPPLDQILPSHGDSPIEYVVTSYSREERVLSRSMAQTTAHMKFQDTAANKHLSGFTKYLFERKKAAVLKYNGVNLYILPPNKPEDNELMCISSYSSKHLEQNTSSSSAQSSVPSKVHPVSTKPNPAPAPAPAPAAKGGDFLSNIFSKIESTMQ
jgi:hypothetical protein